jgi:hypothetical protein
MGTEGATFSSAMCRYQRCSVEKMLQSCDFPEYVASVYQFQTTSVSLHVVVARPKFVPLKQVGPPSPNELFMGVYHLERFTNASFIIEIAT